MQNVNDDKKSGSHLGRGLESLIPTDIQYSNTGERQKVIADNEIEINKIIADPKQPRDRFDEESLVELANSVKDHGILQPLLVTEENGQYQVIAGERRLRAAKIAGLKKVPVILRTLDEQEKLEVALIENVQRSNLNPLELAASYMRLIEEFNLTQEEVAKRLSKARPTIANTIRLLSLPREIKEGLKEGKITEGHARALLAITDPEKQVSAYREVVAGNLSVREAEKKLSRKKEKTFTKEKDPHFAAAENRLSEIFGTKVELKRKKKGGQILIEYYSAEDLERIFNRLIK